MHHSPLHYSPYLLTPYTPALHTLSGLQYSLSLCMYIYGPAFGERSEVFMVRTNKATLRSEELIIKINSQACQIDPSLPQCKT